MLLRLFPLLFFLLFACTEKNDHTPPPAGSVSTDGVQTIVIQPVGNQMRYATTEIIVKAGTKVRIVMDNIATMENMVHNVAILKPGAKVNDVGMAALAAGAEKDYIPEHEDLLFTTPQAKPGERSEVTFTAPPAGDYPFVCTYPGHWTLMKGVMKSVK
ncbi:MAG: plastocyanin/azurin family copper-binding protein [Calditrichia bacterium]